MIICLLGQTLREKIAPQFYPIADTIRKTRGPVSLKKPIAIMPENFWKSNEADREIDDMISSFLSEWSDPEAEEEEFRSDFFQGLSGRRKKAAFTLMVVWGMTIGLHLVSWGIWVVAGIAGVIMVQGMRLLLARPQAQPKILSDELLADTPTVSLLIAAKNEEAVIGKLVKMLVQLDYPQDKYEVWVVDDNSSDKTGGYFPSDGLTNQLNYHNIRTYYYGKLYI